MLQTDSISSAEITGEQETAQQVHHSKPRHPYEVLKWLPKDATPEQQDSIIQANFQPEHVSYNTRVDTLTVFGLKYVGKTKLSAMRYSQESPFVGSPYYHPEQGMSRPGVAGDPVPYTFSGDNLITSLLVGCFLLALLSFSKSKAFLLRQMKHFFYVPRSNDMMGETSGELRFQFVLTIQTCLLFAILAYFYANAYIATTYQLPSPYYLIGIFFLAVVGYSCCKILLYGVVNWTFFDKKKNGQWVRSYLFTNSLEGICLFPIVMLLTYFNLSIENAMTSVLVVVVLSKLLAFYKLYIIFFRGLGNILQIILYFCALEMVPLLSLLGVLVLIGNNLKINF